MSVRKKNGRWYAEFMKARKRISRKCPNCTTRKQAEAYEKILREQYKEIDAQQTVAGLAEIKKRELTGGKTILLADAFELYLSKPARHHAGSEKEAINRRHWNDFIAFMAQNYPKVIQMDQVERVHAEAYIDFLRKNGRFVAEVRSKRMKHADSYTPQRTSLGSTTINAYHTICKAVFRRLGEDAGISDKNNPFQFDTMAAHAENRDIFTTEDLKLIDDNLSSDPFCRPLFILGANTGLSLGDVCTLRWSQVHDGFIIRHRNKTGTLPEIPILPAVRELLEELSVQNAQQPGESGDDFILPAHAQMYKTNRTGVSYRVKRFLERLGIATTRETDGAREVSVKDFHSFRHTFAYNAGVGKVSQPVIQSVLGHMTPEMTRHYQEHATREDAANALRQLPSLLGDPGASQDAEAETLRQKAIQLIKKLPIEEIEAFLRQHKGASKKKKS